MADQRIKERVRKLCERVVLVEPSDLPGLGDLYTQLEEIGKWAAEASEPEVAEAAEAAVKLLKDVILEEAPDPMAFLETMGQACSAFSAIICDGRSAAEVAFPPELGLGENREFPPSGDTRTTPSPSEDRVPPSVSLPPHVDEEIFADFLSRQGEVLDRMEELVLALETSENPDKVGALRRLIHTVKGEAALLGLDDVEKICHATEDLLDDKRPGEIVECLLGVKDWLARTFARWSGKGPAPAPVGQAWAALTGHRLPTGEITPTGNSENLQKEGHPPVGDTPATEAGEAGGGRGSFEADVGLLEEFASEATEHLEAADLHLLTLETEPRNAEALNSVFRAFHTIKGVAGFLALDRIGALAHEAENLLDLARKGEVVLEGTAIDVTFDAVDALKRLVGDVCGSFSTEKSSNVSGALPELLDRIRDAASGQGSCGRGSTGESGSSEANKLGEILVKSGVASLDSINAALRKQDRGGGRPKLGEQLVQDGKAPAKEIAHALRQQRTGDRDQSGPRMKEAVRVDADRLDRLVETIGELVIAESMVKKSIEMVNNGSSRLAGQLSQLDKITRELQAFGTSLRMVPMRSTFQKMARLVRDLSKKAGKSVEFVVSGEETELDKSVVDGIGDPLVHMVRNAIDHGLEKNAEERRQAGKPEKGRVELRAFHKGGNIYIEIEDDGRGLDREVILAKARERQLVREGELPSDEEVFSLIFDPGFSTAQEITDVSGRGVGMDVVKRNIEALRGQVEIRSEPGRGSVFTIRLPLTLAVIDGMVARVGNERYILPTLSIAQSIKPDRKDLSMVFGRGEMLSVQGRLVPLFRLGRLYHIENAEQDLTRTMVVVVDDGGCSSGLVVDELLGQQQIVIKSLGEAMHGIPGISGGAVMPDGQVGLILDVSGLVRLAHGKDTNGSTEAFNRLTEGRESCQ